MNTRIVIATILLLEGVASVARAEEEPDPEGGHFWKVTGNAGTNPAINFLGTTDNQPLVIKTNGTEAVRISASGEVGIGTSTLTFCGFGNCKLEVVGATTSFATGLATLVNSGTGGIGIRAVGDAAGVLGSSATANGPGVAGGSGLTTSSQPGVGVQGAGRAAGVQAMSAAAGSTAVLAQALATGSAAADLFVGQALVPLGAGTVFENRARIDNGGKGFFDGGTQTGGADFAESVAVASDKASYEPGDVLIIDAAGRRRMRTTTQAYSTSIAGIFSTRPGVLATPRSMNDPRLANEIPLAIVGIVPCKVSAENGAIDPGNLLVTSSTLGHAMKGTDRRRMLGAIVGKALEPLRHGRGVIQVLVTLQ